MQRWFYAHLTGGGGGNIALGGVHWCATDYVHWLASLGYGLSRAKRDNVR